MNAPIHALQPLAALVSCAVILLLTVPSRLNAGVTIITHGLNGNVDDWVDAMADAIPEYLGFFGSNFTTYRIDVTFSGDSFYLASIRESGSAATTSESGEIIVKLDWRTLANDSFSTFEVASAVAYGMRLTNFISELSGHALVEFPLHLIGHSRGGSLVCEDRKSTRLNSSHSQISYA